MRMLMNNLDADVAERPQDLVVYGGTGRAARSWEAYHAIVAILEEPGERRDSAGAVGQAGGRVQDARSCATRAHRQFQPGWPLVELGEVQRTGARRSDDVWPDDGGLVDLHWLAGNCARNVRNVFAAGEKHFGGDLAGKLIVSGGMGGMGGAQPLAATMTGAAFLGIDVDPERIKKRLKTGYCDFMVTTLDEALRILKNAVRKKENVSVGLVGNCADVIPELAERGVVPDILTDQTSAHDPLNGYVPNGMTLAEAVELRKSDPKAYQEKSLDAMARTWKACCGCRRWDR
jgi:urocanate hydratase